MIEYKKIKSDCIDQTFLQGFNRYQVTEAVMYVRDNSLYKKNDYFVENWDDSKLRRLSIYLRDSVSKGNVLLAAYEKNKLKGFALLETEFFNDGYVNLDYLHVSRDFRGKGIGRKLFGLISEEASIIGAKKLYISGHPNVHTQAFYKSMGCVLAKQINQRLFDEEPLDIHLEKVL